MAGILDEKDGLFTFVKEFPAKSPATIVGVGDDYVVLKVTPMEGRDYAVTIPVACFVLKVPYWRGKRFTSMVLQKQKPLLGKELQRAQIFLRLCKKLRDPSWH